MMAQIAGACQPVGASHAAQNVGSGRASELATYIVDKGKPLVVLTQ
jgi:hypothetical protein